MCAENLAPTGIRSPERPARIQSLYRLSYSAHVHSPVVSIFTIWFYTGSFYFLPKQCIYAKRPGRRIDHPPPSSAEVKERVELYLYSPSGPSWPVLGRTFPLPLWISKLTAIIPVCRNDWLVFTEAESVYCAVRIESLNIVGINFRPSVANQRVNK
jgi:hypothetical protein